MKVTTNIAIASVIMSAAIFAAPASDKSNNGNGNSGKDKDDDKNDNKGITISLPIVTVSVQKNSNANPNSYCRLNNNGSKKGACVETAVVAASISAPDHKDSKPAKPLSKSGSKENVSKPLSKSNSKENIKVEAPKVIAVTVSSNSGKNVVKAASKPASRSNSKDNLHAIAEDTKPAKNDDKDAKKTAEVKVAVQIQAKASADADKNADRAQKQVAKADSPKHSQEDISGKATKGANVNNLPFTVGPDINGVTEGNNGNHFGQLKEKKPKKHNDDSDDDSDSDDDEPVPSPTGAVPSPTVVAPSPTGAVPSPTDAAPSPVDTVPANSTTGDAIIVLFAQQAPIAPELTSSFESDSAPVSADDSTLAAAPVAPVAIQVDGEIAPIAAAPTSSSSSSSSSTKKTGKIAANGSSSTGSAASSAQGSAAEGSSSAQTETPAGSNSGSNATTGAAAGAVGGAAVLSLVLYRRRRQAQNTFADGMDDNNSGAGVNPLYAGQSTHENPMFEGWYDQNKSMA